MFGMVGLRNCGWIRASTCHRAWTAKRWNPELGGKATVARLRPGLTGAFVGYWGCMHSGQKVQARCGGCTPARAATLMQGKRAGEKYIGCSIAPLSDWPKGQWQRRRLAWGRVGQWLAGTGAGTGGGGPCRGRGARPAAAAEAAPAASPAAAAEAPWLAAGEERGAPGWGRTGRTRQGPRRSHLLAAEPVSPGSASGCAHGASERGAGRAPSAHRRRRSRPSVPLSLRVAGLEPRAAPELRDFMGEESAVECARAAGTRVAGRTPRLERWRAGGGAAVGQVGRGPLAGGGRRCAGGTGEASPRLLPGLGFLHLKEAASGTPLPPDPVHPQVGSRSSPGVPGDIWKAWR